MQRLLQRLRGKLASAHGQVKELAGAAAAARREFKKAQSQDRKQLGHRNYSEARNCFSIAREAEKRKQKIESQLEATRATIEEAESDTDSVERELVIVPVILSQFARLQSSLARSRAIFLVNNSIKCYYQASIGHGRLKAFASRFAYRVAT